MLICNPYEIVIQGMTNNNKRFRPSDWAERLCGVLSSFDQGHRLSYHQWVRPILVDNIRCVAVDRKLEQISATAFNFLMDFARDNDLRILDCKALLEEQEHKQISLIDAMAQENAETTKQQPTNPQTEAVEHHALVNQLRELTSAETTSAFATLHRLHPNIRDITQFQELVQIQQAEGYRLLGIFEEGKQNAITICGFRIVTNFASGRHLHIDDLASHHSPITDEQVSQIFGALKIIAVKENCNSIHADSSVSSDNSNMHHVYLKHGFVLSSHKFSLTLD
ncbi:DUF3579 domain-containing protein [Snodgrassella alvi]|uniref:PhnO-related protein n=1 Tax=Snodgrassella alvi TaxID=1196083 RepID=A0A2N9WWK7_9NEIS|nr:DUF3579 domain-containing protein [Snodgrassella alvi]PIT13285.1 hypothetical protein BGI33_11550 [Snodgrassella alvi]PIT18612.1 hypothetical protein BGI32_00690 [Snodgrassella alvi]PIT18802.1 hypothetical protein BGI34_04525 [Snodgrassella alvi]